MTTLLSFILLLGILVTIHEIGHFFAARSVGVYVEKFSIGMPPRIFTTGGKLLCQLPGKRVVLVNKGRRRHNDKSDVQVAEVEA